MKKSAFILLVACIALNAQAQKVRSYDKNGKPLKSFSEFVEIIVTKGDPGAEGFKSAAIPGLIAGPVFNIAHEQIKAALEKRQKSFIASYSNSEDITGNIKNAKAIVVTRYALNDINKPDQNSKTGEFIFDVSPDANHLTIALRSVEMLRSKARYKSGDNLCVTITIKVTAVQSEENKPKTVESEGTIVIPLLKVSDAKQDLNDNKYINSLVLRGINASGCSSLKFAVTVTETNINRVDPSVLQSLFLNNKDNLQALLKAALGVKEE